jgi:hypothetical protein
MKNGEGSTIEKKDTIYSAECRSKFRKTIENTA